MNFFADNVPRKARLVICAFMALGLPVLLYSLLETLYSPNSGWLIIAGLTAVASFFPVHLPYLKKKPQTLTFTASDIFVFTAILLFSPEVATTISVIDVAVGIRTRKPYRIGFNVSQGVLVTFLVGHLFYQLQGLKPPLHPEDVHNLLGFFLKLFLCALLYFILNSGAIAFAVSLVTANSAREIWTQNLLSTALANTAGAVAAAAIFFNFEQARFLAVSVAIPVVLLLHYAFQSNRHRLETLRRSKLFLQSTLDSLSSAIAILDQTGEIIATNEGWRRFSGNDRLFGAGHQVGINYLQVCESAPGELAPHGRTLAGAAHRIMAGKSPNGFHLEYSSSEPEGTRWFTARITRFEGEGQVRVVVAHDDITELKRAEEALRQSEGQLRQSQKMEAIGRLAGGVAHDFNNMLTVILGHCDLLLGLYEERPLNESLEEIKKASSRAASLTRQLLTFGRKQGIPAKVVDMNALIADTEKMLRRLIGEDVELTVTPEPRLDPIRADPGQVEQVIVNLAINSRDAMPEGGRIDIRATNEWIDESYARKHHGLHPGRHVLLVVRDTGSGMDQDTLARIFEPFFTTKDVGRGTGLGLSTVYGIVKQANGYITASSRPGQGTTFRIYIPSINEKDGMSPGEEPPPSLFKGSETVLLVEDEDTVRGPIRKILEKNGYRVLEASTPQKALLLCDRHQDHIDLLLTDVVMPEMSGTELAQRLSLLRPAMKILFISGYLENQMPKDGQLVPGTAFLPKPFTWDTLSKKVREVLDAGERG
ncbi:MAG: ATP-binding protein [Acidobacteriota bacterium]